ncbi:DUF2231 domain-containing protein [Lysobacter korlensis]|uniref:DUF2231 domain-containing protein n=1 Tax=Lysobacter korlensis TaxID=553636 RepID=A0ABV6RX60_9GAMM
MSDLSALRRAKRPRTPLAGPYGHPFHAMLVTVPIGAWTGALVFDLVSFFSGDPEAFVRGAKWLVGIGVIGALVAAVFGLMDLSILTRGTKARRVALTHMALNIAAIVLFAVSFLLRLNGPQEGPAVAGFVAALVGFAAVGASGFLGGELTYRHGVRVADEETQAQAHR